MCASFLFLFGVAVNACAFVRPSVPPSVRAVLLVLCYTCWRALALRASAGLLPLKTCGLAAVTLESLDPRCLSLVRSLARLQKGKKEPVMARRCNEEGRWRWQIHQKHREVEGKSMVLPAKSSPLKWGLRIFEIGWGVCVLALLAFQNYWCCVCMHSNIRSLDKERNSILNIGLVTKEFYMHACEGSTCQKRKSFVPHAVALRCFIFSTKSGFIDCLSIIPSEKIMKCKIGDFRRFSLRYLISIKLVEYGKLREFKI